MALIEFKDYPNTSTPLNAENLNNNFNEILNLLCPIGKVEVFFDNQDHSNHLGFTWERTSIGRVPVGIDSNDNDFNTIGKTGGEKTHKLTIEEMPSHNHNVLPSSAGSGGSQFPPTGSWNNSPSGLNWYTSSKGGDQPHNNLQPYEVMAFWKRVS